MVEAQIRWLSQRHMNTVVAKGMVDGWGIPRRLVRRVSKKQENIPITLSFTHAILSRQVSLLRHADGSNTCVHGEPSPSGCGTSTQHRACFPGHLILNLRTSLGDQT